MSAGAFFWLTIFGLAALCFFTVAAIVAVKGWFDLKDLLTKSSKGKL